MESCSNYNPKQKITSQEDKFYNDTYQEDAVTQ